MAKPEAPEFARLDAASKTLVRRIGATDAHQIEAANGVAGKGWRSLEDAGWVKIRDHDIGGYVVAFNLSGWEWWCRQCDAEEGNPLQPLEFSDEECA